MKKSGFLQVGDKISTKKFGRWTIIDIADEFITMVKIRKGVVSEVFKIRADRFFS